MADKAYKVRIYLKPKQIAMANRMIGCARWVFNHFLEWHQELYKAEGRYLGFAESCRMLTIIKASPATKWLGEADKFALQNSLRHLDRHSRTSSRDGPGHPRQRVARGSRVGASRNRLIRRILRTTTFGLRGVGLSSRSWDGWSLQRTAGRFRNQ